MSDDPRSFEHDQYSNNPQEYPTNLASRPYSEMYQPPPPHHSMSQHPTASIGSQQHRSLAQNTQQQTHVVLSQSDHSQLQYPPPHRVPPRPHLAYIPHPQHYAPEYPIHTNHSPIYDQPGQQYDVQANISQYGAFDAHVSMNTNGVGMPSGGPPTPGAIHSPLQYTATGSSSSRDSSTSTGTSSPVTPNSTHSTLASIPMGRGPPRSQEQSRQSISHARTASNSSHSTAVSAHGATQNGGSLVHRTPRHSHTSSTDGSMSGRSTRRSRRSSSTSAGTSAANSNDSEDLENELLETITDTRAQRLEEARLQRQNAEQQRRDHLREGYDRLQGVLPNAREKMSKVRLIAHATQHIQNVTVANDKCRERITALETERDLLRRQNEEVSHQLSGLPVPPPPVLSSITPPAHPSVTTNIPPPPPSSLPTAIPNIGLHISPSANLPVPIAGTGPPGQQRHNQNPLPYTSFPAPPYHQSSGPPHATNTQQLVPPTAGGQDQAPMPTHGQHADQVNSSQLPPGPQEHQPGTPVPVSMPMQMSGMESGYTQDNTVVNGNSQTMHTESVNPSGNQPVPENGGPSENGQLYS